MNRLRRSAGGHDSTAGVRGSAKNGLPLIIIALGLERRDALLLEGQDGRKQTVLRNWGLRKTRKILRSGNYFGTEEGQ